MKTKLCSIISCCLMFIGGTVLAQDSTSHSIINPLKGHSKISLDAGLVSSNRNSNISNLINSNYYSRNGAGVNLSFEYMFFKSVFVTTGVGVLQKNYAFVRDGIDKGWYDDYNRVMVQVPLMLGTYLFNNTYKGKGFWGKLAVGGYMDYVSSLKRDGQFPVFAEPRYDDERNYAKVSETYDFKENRNGLRRTTYGLQGQAQVGYTYQKYDFFGALGYQYGLTDITNYNQDENRKATINSTVFTLGVSYKF